MKQCKQCGRTLEDDCFRKTKSRSKGIYKNTTQGSRNICKACESLDVRVHKALRDNDEKALVELRKHYSLLSEMGLPPVTAGARRLMGLTSPDGVRQNEVLALTQQHELMEHAHKVRNRLYASVEEADEAHRALAERLKVAGLYEEITILLDDWYFE